jgi:integrase
MSKRRVHLSQPFGNPGNTCDPTHGKQKPDQPNPDFPLFPHNAGVWAKKIRGKMHYFGPWDDPDGALKRYLEQKDDLHAGRTPRERTEGTTVKDACNHFLNAKQSLVDAGELTPASWREYKAFADEVVAHTGKGRLVSDLRPDDFAALRKKLAKKWGPHRLKKAIQCIRSVFKHAHDSGLIDRPMSFGPGFARPSLKVLRLHRAERGVKLFTADEIRRLVDVAGTQLRAMILLGVNCGLGNTDCAGLTRSAINLDTGWLDYPRPKTGILRRCPLWPETIAAVRAAAGVRPAPRDPADADLVFLTRCGQRWARDDDPGPLTREMRKLLDRLGIDGHRNFYAIRHTFRTAADGAKDQPAADHIMGHEVPHMSSVYREGISDERLKAVTDHVHAWLFAAAEGSGPTAALETEDEV